MKLKDKQELVRLLNLYQEELIKDNEVNIKEIKSDKHYYEKRFKYGIKAKYEHSRLIINQLSMEIGKELKSNYELI